eukprot:1161047-Pelagomonas_calceolata.AAC.18
MPVHAFTKIPAVVSIPAPQIDPAIMSKQEIPPAPLLEIQLELIAPDIVWKPDLGEVPEGMVGNACHGEAVALVGFLADELCLAFNPQGVRDLVKLWLMSFMEIGGLMKRLDVGEGNYTKELEEDYDVYDAMNQVMEVTLVNEQQCEQFKEQFSKFDYLWKKDLHTALQEFCDANGTTLPVGGEQTIMIKHTLACFLATKPAKPGSTFARVAVLAKLTTLVLMGTLRMLVFTQMLCCQSDRGGSGPLNSAAEILKLEISGSLRVHQHTLISNLQVQ